MGKLLKERSKKTGLPPGSLVPVTDQRVKSAKITVIDYDSSNLAEKTLENASECSCYKQTPTVTWINLDSVSDAQAVHTIGEVFGLHARQGAG